MAGDALLFGEQAALAWTEAVTEIGRERVSDELYSVARQHFSEKELVNLTMAGVAINSWNRLAITFRAMAGSYQPGSHEHSGPAGPADQRETEGANL